jgi:hypothetical protein
MDVEFLMFVLVASMYLICPLCIIILTLSVLHWNSNRTIFSDSWHIWLSWLATRLIAFIFVTLAGIKAVPAEVSVVLGFNILGGAVLILRSRRPSRQASIFNSNPGYEIVPGEIKLWAAVICTGVLPPLTVLATVLRADLGSNLADRMSSNPGPKIKYNSYDY